MLHNVTICYKREGPMGVIRIDNDLQKKVEKWIKVNGNKYQFPSISSFVNNAIYEKLKRLNNDKKKF